MARASECDPRRQRLEICRRPADEMGRTRSIGIEYIQPGRTHTSSGTCGRLGMNDWTTSRRVLRRRPKRTSPDDPEPISNAGASCSRGGKDGDSDHHIKRANDCVRRVTDIVRMIRQRRIRSKWPCLPEGGLYPGKWPEYSGLVGVVPHPATTTPSCFSKVRLSSRCQLWVILPSSIV